MKKIFKKHDIILVQWETIIAAGIVSSLYLFVNVVMFLAS